ncbi:hypothetical protein JOQ06_019993 [Pogonophryne albipinna]|uniref:Uncharacterized protein n=1 Tax=Pogonophryne albipinna TaxID=1090488 RepID=A0AAD6BQ75_9TELE|nr:hypothetical protein JOQ06_019993 [Pogonophryne albipinna]
MHRHLFTGGRDTAANGYQTILAKMGVECRVTHAQAKQKWENLKTKNASVPPSGKGTRDGKPTAATWPWFVLMDEALGQSAAVSPPCLIASIQEDNPGPSTAQEGQRGREDEEEEKDKEDTERQRGRVGGMKKREREEDILYQREAEERRGEQQRPEKDPEAAEGSEAGTLYTQRIQSAMPSGSASQALDLSRQELLGRFEGLKKPRDRSDGSLKNRHGVYMLCQHSDIWS